MTWLYPLGFTAVAALVCGLAVPKSKPTNYYPDVGAAVIAGALALVWVIVSLAAWLVWALVR